VAGGNGRFGSLPRIKGGKPPPNLSTRYSISLSISFSELLASSLPSSSIIINFTVNVVYLFHVSSVTFLNASDTSSTTITNYKVALAKGEAMRQHKKDIVGYHAIPDKYSPILC
jgi:hypothetical protein